MRRMTLEESSAAARAVFLTTSAFIALSLLLGVAFEAHEDMEKTPVCEERGWCE